MNIIKHYLKSVNTSGDYFYSDREIRDFQLCFPHNKGWVKQELAKRFGELAEWIKYESDFMNLLKMPMFLLNDIEYTVSTHFDKSLEKYFKSVEIFFKKFNEDDVYLANLDEMFIDKFSLDCERWGIVECLNIDELGKNPARKVRKLKNELLYHMSVCLKLVGKNGKNYCSNTLFNVFKLKKVAEQEFVKNNAIVGEDGKVIPLEKVTKTVETNIAEKLNIISTMERIALDKGFTWCFITLTLPGEFHPNPSKGTCSYNGVSPRKSGQLLNSKFALARSHLAKRGLKAGSDYFGTTTAEAHKDGCLHKHVLMFCSEKNIDLVKSCFQNVFGNMNEGSFREDEELQNRLERNDQRAKASSYIFKYVMKSLTAFDKNLKIMEQTAENNKQVYNSMLNNAFRSFNSIRGVTFFGIENCLSKFRFLARNKKRILMSARLEEVIANNDLYAFITERHCDDVINTYIMRQEQKMFVGCVVDNIQFLKRFFTMGKKKTVEAVPELFKELALLTSSFVNSMVTLNHNYSRNSQKTQLPIKIPIPVLI